MVHNLCKEFNLDFSTVLSMVDMQSGVLVYKEVSTKILLEPVSAILVLVNIMEFRRVQKMKATLQLLVKRIGALSPLEEGTNATASLLFVTLLLRRRRDCARTIPDSPRFRRVDLPPHIASIWMIGECSDRCRSLLSGPIYLPAKKNWKCMCT